MCNQSWLILSVLLLTNGCAPSVDLEPAEESREQVSQSAKPEPLSSARERQIVQVTDAAVAKLKQYLEASPTGHVRISVKEEGSSFTYGLNIDESIDDSDFVDTSEGFKVVVDSSSAVYLEGVTIDWVVDPNGQGGFKFDNPNAMKFIEHDRSQETRARWDDQEMSLEAEPWVSQLPADWPLIVLTNEALFRNSTPLNGASAFLLRTADNDVYAATAAHLIGSAGGVEPQLEISKLNAEIVSWKLFPRTLPERSVEATRLAISGLERTGLDWLVLELKSSDDLPALPLQIRERPVEVGEQVFLFGCPYTERDCIQNVYKGRITERSGDRFRYQIDPPVELPGFSGAPIVDSKGHLVGVMTLWFDAQMQGDKYLEAGGEDATSLFPYINER